MSHATIKMIDFPEGGQWGLLSLSIVCLVQFVEFFFFFKLTLISVAMIARRGAYVAIVVDSLNMNMFRPS